MIYHDLTTSYLLLQIIQHGEKAYSCLLVVQVLFKNRGNLETRFISFSVHPSVLALLIAAHPLMATSFNVTNVLFREIFLQQNSSLLGHKSTNIQLQRDIFCIKPGPLGPFRSHTWAHIAIH
jgi:hypothetical protein